MRKDFSFEYPIGFDKAAEMNFQNPYTKRRVETASNRFYRDFNELNYAIVSNRF